MHIGMGTPDGAHSHPPFLQAPARDLNGRTVSARERIGMFDPASAQDEVTALNKVCECNEGLTPTRRSLYPAWVIVLIHAIQIGHAMVRRVADADVSRFLQFINFNAKPTSSHRQTGLGYLASCPVRHNSANR